MENDPRVAEPEVPGQEDEVFPPRDEPEIDNAQGNGQDGGAWRAQGQGQGEAEEANWNPMEWDRPAEELTWERLLGLDGSLLFLEHVFWVVSLNTLFIMVRINRRVFCLELEFNDTR